MKPQNSNLIAAHADTTQRSLLNETNATQSGLCIKIGVSCNTNEGAFGMTDQELEAAILRKLVKAAPAEAEVNKLRLRLAHINDLLNWSARLDKEPKNAD
jgi:hypothetical protein